MTTATKTAADVRTVTVSTKYGDKSVQSALTPVQAIQVLSALDNPSSFAVDLVTNSCKWGLSPKQSNWAIFLAQEALDKSSKPAAAPVAPVANFDALFTLFDKARGNLKFPRLRLADTDGRPVVLKVCGSGSKHCGSISVTNGGKYGASDNVFYGYVHTSGEATVRDEGVLALLKALAADPAAVVASHGLASGECCCCGRALSDSEAGSSEVGYGPICADHWGLPWQPNGKAAPVVVAPVADAAPVVAPKGRRTRKAKAAAAPAEVVAPITELTNTPDTDVSKAVLDSVNEYLKKINADPVSEVKVSSRPKATGRPVVPSRFKAHGCGNSR